MRAISRLCPEQQMLVVRKGVVQDLPDVRVVHPKPGARFVLDDALHVFHDDRHFMIPKGFVTDRASIPRLAFPFISKDDLGLLAPLVHDYLYFTLGATLRGPSYSRAEADKLFKLIMKAEGVTGWKWRLAYAAVRLFGSYDVD